MKEIKKIASFFLITILTSLTFIGCTTSSDNASGGNTTADTTSANTTSAPENTTQNTTQAESTSAKKIVLFQSKVEIIDQLEKLAEDYKKEKGVEIEVIGTTGDDYFQQLKAKMSSNQGPTVFSVYPGAETEQMAAYLENLSDLSFVNDIAQGMASKIDDKVVGIPYTVEGFGMVYNKNLIDPSTVNNYDSFVKMLEEQKANGINGFGLSQESYFLIGHILNTPFALQKDPKDFIEKLNAGQVKMADTPEFQEFAKFYSAIKNNSYNPLEANYDKECGDFATGKTASIHQGNWAFGMFKDYEMDFDMGLMPFPLSGNDKLAVSVPSAWSVNSQAKDEEKKAGKEFLEWLYTSETGKRYLMDEFGFIPVVKGMESKNLDVLSSDVSKYANEGKTIGWPLTMWPAGIVDVHLVPVAEKFFTTDMSEEDFLKALDEAWIEANK